MTRATQAGGVVAAYVWDYVGEMQLLRHFWDAASAIDPVAAAPDEGRRFSLCQPAPLAALFRAAGLAKVTVRCGGRKAHPFVFRPLDGRHSAGRPRSGWRTLARSQSSPPRAE